MRFLIRWLINAAALWICVRFVPGVTYDGQPAGLLVVALVLGILNATVGPILKILTCPMLILTLGLFTFIINAFVLWLTSVLSESLGLGFHVAGFWPAFLGALVISLVSVLLSVFLADTGRDRVSS